MKLRLWGAAKSLFEAIKQDEYRKTVANSLEK